MGSNLGFGDFAVLCCGGVFVLLFVVFALFTGTLGRLFGLGNNIMRRPGGSFNNPNERSGGRIGGAPGFNNPFESGGGRIGGGQSFDNPDTGSSGSIGGRPTNKQTTNDQDSGGGASFG